MWLTYILHIHDAVSQHLKYRSKMWIIWLQKSAWVLEDHNSASEVPLRWFETQFCLQDPLKAFELSMSFRHNWNSHHSSLRNYSSSCWDWLYFSSFYFCSLLTFFPNSEEICLISCEQFSLIELQRAQVNIQLFISASRFSIGSFHITCDLGQFDFRHNDTTTLNHHLGCSVFMLFANQGELELETPRLLCLMWIVKSRFCYTLG